MRVLTHSHLLNTLKYSTLVSYCIKHNSRVVLFSRSFILFCDHLKRLGSFTSFRMTKENYAAQSARIHRQARNDGITAFRFSCHPSKRIIGEDYQFFSCSNKYIFIQLKIPYLQQTAYNAERAVNSV